MPRNDGTGPRGEGPLTGKGQGFCVVQLSDNTDGVSKNKTEEVVQMPGGNGTGPMGMGPMTGRAAGLCAGLNRPGYANFMSGRGMGQRRGAGLGRGLGRGLGLARGLGWRTGSSSAQDEASLLKGHVQRMEEEIGMLNSRIKELESQPGSEKNPQ